MLLAPGGQGDTLREVGQHSMLHRPTQEEHQPPSQRRHIHHRLRADFRQLDARRRIPFPAPTRACCEHFMIWHVCPFIVPEQNNSSGGAEQSSLTLLTQHDSQRLPADTSQRGRMQGHEGSMGSAQSRAPSWALHCCAPPSLHFKQALHVKRALQKWKRCRSGLDGS